MKGFKSRGKFLIMLSILLIFGLGLKTNNILFGSSNINLIKGENRSLNISFPFFLDIIEEKENVVEASYSDDSNALKKSYNLNGIETGNADLQVKLLGVIPVKSYNVSVVNRPELVPAGNAIGVRLNTKGVLVVAVTDVIDTNGQRMSPAKEAGLKVGDSILEINDIKIQDAQHVVQLLNELKDKNLKILIQRNKAEFLTESKAVQSIQDNCYRLGIWVRDKTSGIGTLTFYNPKNNQFGALGHGIVDVDTGGLLSVDKGKIMNAKISKVEQGKKGTPGEIRGVFYETDNLIGDIKLNSPYGIYGVISDEYKSTLDNKSMPIAFQDEVKEGKAYILTTVDNKKVEKFEIEILKLNSQNKIDQKSMVIKVTDPILLEKTGGIVQGMSGSPIIQDNKIIGAVTHVFVNDPTKGYGIYIEWMLEELNKQ